jgi:hypothetical protein
MKFSKFLFPAFCGVIALTLTGCGVGQFSTDNAHAASPLTAFSGKAMGGETPISGANVILWETDPANTGYGLTARNIQSQTTGANGLFSFATGYSCTNANDFLYITVTGGDVSNGGNVINNNEVQIAALGSCANFATTAQQSSTWVNVNEVSTVATAYALGNFMSVAPNGGTGNQLVYIGASAKNSATTGACTGTGASMSCTAAGLAHAFQNAIDLTDSFHTDGSYPTGLARTTVPGNSLGSIPQAEIHALADILQTCTNSAGGVAGDGTTCGTLFTYATPSGGTAPTDELSAIINISKYPRHNIGSTCTAGSITGGLFCMITTTPAFSPVLSKVPYDWSLGITYTGLGNLTNTSWGSPSTTPYYPEGLALDANDNVYILSGNQTTSATSVTSTLSAMNSAGTGIWANAPSVDGAIGCYPGTVATDTNSNVWYTYAPSSGKTCTANIQAKSATSGASTYSFTSATPYTIQGQANAIAFDRWNNLWYARDTSAGSGMLFSFPYTPTSGSVAYNGGATAAAYYTFSGTSSSGTLANVYGLAIDANANVYATSYSSSANGSLWIIPNQTPSSTPSYSTTSTNYLTFSLINSGTAPTHSGAIGFDPNFATNGVVYATAASGNFTRLNISPIPSSSNIIATSTTCAACTTTGILAQNTSSTGASTPFNGQIDSAGTFWYVNFTSSGQIWYSLTSPSTTSFTSDSIATCYAPSGGTLCTNLTYTVNVPSSTSTSTGTPHILQIDSTGAIWVAAEAAGNVVQILGPAAPLWPQTSYGVFATKP